MPGPSTVHAALVAERVADRALLLRGFPAPSGSGRSERLAALASERRTIVLYEAPHRVARTLEDLVGALGPDRRVAVVA